MKDNKEKWNFIALNRELVKRKKDVKNQKYCNHDYWIAKCSTCGKILASELQDTAGLNIKIK